MVKLIVNNIEIEAEKGSNLLKACIANNIYIPNLCYMEEISNTPASCRLCFVQIDEVEKPVNSCSIKIREGMIVKTDTPKIRELQRTAFELLLSAHRVECKSCSANKKCELQKIAKFLHLSLKPKRLDKILREVKEEDHPYLKYDHTKCVACGRCVSTCGNLYENSYLTFAYRSLNTTISFYGETDPEKIPCAGCYACVEKCPVGALIKKKGNYSAIAERFEPIIRQ